MFFLKAVNRLDIMIRELILAGAQDDLAGLVWSVLNLVDGGIS